MKFWNPKWAIGAIEAIGALGCAQNSEPAGKMIQSNRGPNTPQEQRFVYNIIAGDYYGAPASQPAGDVAAAEKDKSETAIWARANPATGLASVQGPRNGRNHNVSIWTDASSAASPNVGSMNPSATQDLPVTATQDVKPNVNPSLAFGMPGSAVTSSANGTQGTGSGSVAGAPQTTSPTQSGFQATLKGAQDQIAQLFQQLLGAWNSLHSAGNAATSAPAG